MDRCMNTETDKVILRRVEMRELTELEGGKRCFQSFLGGLIAALN